MHWFGLIYISFTLSALTHFTQYPLCNDVQSIQERDGRYGGATKLWPAWAMGARTTCPLQKVQERREVADECREGIEVVRDWIRL